MLTEFLSFFLKWKQLEIFIPVFLLQQLRSIVKEYYSEAAAENSVRLPENWSDPLLALTHSFMSYAGFSLIFSKAKLHFYFQNRAISKVPPTIENTILMSWIFLSADSLSFILASLSACSILWTRSICISEVSLNVLSNRSLMSMMIDPQSKYAPRITLYAPKNGMVSANNVEFSSKVEIAEVNIGFSVGDSCDDRNRCVTLYLIISFILIVFMVKGSGP